MAGIVTTSCKVSALILCAAAGAALCPATGVPFFASAAGATLGGAAGNFFQDMANAVFGWFGERSLGPTQPPTNHDLDHLAARSIRRCFCAARDALAKNDAKRAVCARLAAVEESVIVGVLQSESFRELSDEDAIAMLGAPLGGLGTKTKTPEHWVRFVAEVAKRSRAEELRRRESNAAGGGILSPVRRDAPHLDEPPATPDAIAFIASHVHHGIAGQANEILRDTFGPKGRPYVAAQMIYANKTLSLLASDAQRSEARHVELLALLQSLQSNIDRLAAVLGTMLDEAAAPLLIAANENLALLRRLSGGLDGIQASLFEVVRGAADVVHLLTSGPRLKPLVLPPGGEPGTLRGARRIDFILRDTEIRELLEFLAGDQPVAWQLWHGAAGMGKSRLAFELCRIVDRSWEGKPSVWTAGFLDLPRVVVGDWSQWRIDRPTLIVVDYAQERSEEIKSLIERVAQDAQHKVFPTVRFLLLEREQHPALLSHLLPDGDAEGWMASVAYRGKDGIARPSRALAPFAKGDVAHLVEAVYAARQQAAAPAETQRHLPSAETVAAVFESSRFELRPLFAILAAEAAIEGKDPATLSHEGLARDWLGHEFRTWRKHFPAGDQGEDSYERHRTLVALATLAQGLPSPQGYRAIHDMLDACGTTDLLPPGGAFAANWDALACFYSLGKTETPESIPALRPDYLGELFVLDHIQTKVTNGAARRALLYAALVTSPTGFVHFLGRMATAHSAHPSVRKLVHELDHVMTSQTEMIEVARRSGELDLLLGTIAGKLGLSDIKWRSFDRASQLVEPQGAILRLLAEQYIATYRYRDRASELLERWASLRDATFTSYFSALKSAVSRRCSRAAVDALIEAMEAASAPNVDVLCHAAGHMAKTLGEREAAKRLLARLETMEGVSGDVLAQAAGNLATALGENDAAMRLLARLETMDDLNGDVLCHAAGHLANALGEKEAAKRLLARLEAMEGVSGQALAVAAGHLVNTLADPEAARRLLARLETMEDVNADVLCHAAGHLANALGDKAAAKRLLIRVETMEGLTAQVLSVAAGHWAGALGERNAAKRLLARLETMEGVNGHDLTHAATLLADHLGEIELAEKLLSRLLTLTYVKSPHWTRAMSLCRRHGLDAELTGRIMAQM